MFTLVHSDGAQPANSNSSSSVVKAPIRRILLRSYRDLREPTTPEAVANNNLIGDNAGNTIFAQAVHRTISVPRAAVTVDRGRANPEDAARINENFDQYVIPLANAFRPTFQDSLDRYSELIEHLTIPVVVVGVGVKMNVQANNPERLDGVRPSIERFMRAVLARSASVGVRGETTYKYLRSIGFSEDEVTVVGCPSLFQFGDTLAIRPLTEVTPESRMTINISPYKPQMGPITTATVARYSQLRYVAQDIATMRTLLFGEMPPDAENFALDVPYRPGDHLLTKHRAEFFIDPTAWIKWLSGRDFSFGTRIHGNITSLLAGTPAFVIAHDSRTRELVEYHEIPYALLSSLAPDVDPRDLFASADYSAFHHNQTSRFQNYLKFLERNDIEHVFTGTPEVAASAAAFDAKVGSVSWTRPITNITRFERGVRAGVRKARGRAKQVRQKLQRPRT